MSFIKLNYIYIIVPALIILVLYLFSFYRKGYQFAELYWFFVPKRRYLVSRLFYLAFIVLLVFSLLDLRGKEEVVEAEIPELKTIILIDTSSSMLAEDVKPNRFQRSIFMARHFVRQAIGHQVAVVLFSDTQKKIVPFTDDTELLDARLDGLKTLDITNGGTNLSQALVESIQYLKVDSGTGRNVSGSLVIFTDAEPHDSEFKVAIDEGVSVALVAVGTSRGAQVPIRNERGIFEGYKKYNGEPVISKINEDYLKNLGSEIKNYKYWVASSYSMLTDDILAFINSNINAKKNTSDLRTRPVLSKYLIVPAIILYLLANLLSLGKNWKPATFLFCLFIGSLDITNSFANEEEEKPLDPETIMFLERNQRGELNDKGRLKLAQLLLKNEKTEESLILYEEILENKLTTDELSLFNWATANLIGKNLKKSVDLYSQLYRMLEKRGESEEIKDFVRGNLLLALIQQQQEQQQQQQEEQNQEKEEKKEDKQDQSGGEGNNQDKKDEGKDKKDSQNNDGKDNQSNSGSGGENSPKTLEEYQDMVKKMKNQTKVPAVIKQIMSDDRTLQEKHIDTSTQDRSTIQKRDW